MPGAIFQVLLTGGLQPFITTFTDKINAALSGTFTSQPGGVLVVLSLGWQSGTTSTLNSATIGGHAATIIDAGGVAGTNQVAMCAAFVSVGDPNTWSVTLSAAVTSSRIEVYIHHIKNAISLSTTKVLSSANNPTGSLSVLRNGAAIGVAKTQGASGVNSWTGLSQDSADAIALQTYTCAHSDFSADNPSLSITCNFTSPVGSTSRGLFVAFNP